MVILIGRPNVGKSTLFNRLTGEQAAIVSPVAGTTINKKVGVCTWLGKTISIVDMAGFPLPKNVTYPVQIMDQIATSLKDAKAIMVVFDSRAGLTQEDKDVLDQMRRYNKPIFIILNKVDSNTQPIFDIPGGADGIYLISALHGRGITELLDDLVKFADNVKDQPHNFTLSIVGRQNVGKSTLFNALIEEDRSVVSSEGGTTRDIIEAKRILNNVTIKFIDTAGIRRRGKITGDIERKSAWRSFKAIDVSNAVVCVMDATEGPTRQDIHVMEYARTKKKPLLIVVNKWDLIEDVAKNTKQAEDIKTTVLYRFPSLKSFDIIPVSAVTGWNLSKILDWTKQTQRSRDARLNANL